MECSKIKISNLVPESIVDGKGIRYVVFVQGCPHHCIGCHNPQTHSFQDGKWVCVDDILQQIKQNPLLTGVTFSGGEPFSQPAALLALAQKIKQQTKLNLTIYSGWTYEELIQKSDSSINQLLKLTDYLIDGKYIKQQRDLTLHFRGSKNQRIIDLNATRTVGRIVLDVFEEND